MELNLYANFIGKKGLPFPVVSFELNTAEIMQGHSTVSIHYEPQVGWVDLEGRQYRITSKPQTFKSLRLVQ